MLKKLFIIVLLSITTSVQAQNFGSEIWSWAWNRSTGEVFAYSATGDSNVVLSGVTAAFDELWRLNDSEAVGFLWIDDEKALYTLNSELAIKFEFAFDTTVYEDFLSLDNYPRIAAYSENIIILTAANRNSDIIGSRLAMIIDLTTHQVYLLSDSSQSTIRISESGEYIRYAHVLGEPDDLTLEIREWSLAEETYRVLYTQSGNLLLVDSDTYGENWLVFDQSLDFISEEYTLYSLTSDEAQVIYLRDPETYYYGFGFIGNDIISYSPLCQSDCTVDLYSPDGTNYSFTLPETPGGASINSFYRAEDNRITISRLYDFWTLAIDTSASFQGYIYRGGSHLPSIQSPSNRYALIADTDSYPPSNRYIIDFETDSVLFEIGDELENPLYMTYLTEGFIVNTLGGGTPILFTYSDQAMVYLPDIGNGSFYDILADGSVLYRKLVAESQYQIFRYYPSTSEHQLLIEDVIRVPVVDLSLIASNILNS